MKVIPSYMVSSSAGKKITTTLKMYYAVKMAALSTVYALIPFATSLHMAGRPFTLKGKSYANVFIHFEPAGHCTRHSSRMTGEEVPGDAEVMYRATKQKSAPKVDEMEVLPLHIAPGSVEAKRWMQELPYVVFKSKREVRIDIYTFSAYLSLINHLACCC